MHLIDFNNFDHNFCEASIYSSGNNPEYMNSLSSLFITFIGINGLFKKYNLLNIILLYSTLVVNGITSLFYHYYNTIGWGLMDRMSMILIAISSVNLFLDNVNQFLIYEVYISLGQ